MQLIQGMGGDNLMRIYDKIKALITSESKIYQGASPLEDSALDYNICCISIITGRAPDYDLDGIGLRNPSFRVLVRDSDYDNAYDRMEVIIGLLTAASTNDILAIWLESDILELDKDTRDLDRIYVNFTCKARG